MRLTAVAAPIDLPNIDTDRIIPARFLRKPKGAPGYERFLFHDMRFDADGSERPAFVLNRAPYREATVLVTENFGCGSSREMAVWPLEAYGLRRHLHERPGATVAVDLESRTVTAPSGAGHRFEIDPFAKQMLATGQDEIALTVGYEGEIRAFEDRQKREMDWLVPISR